MSRQVTPPQEHTGLKRDAIGWFTIVLMVITTNGPLTSMGGGVPVGIALGNGIGLPGSYVVVCLAYLLFAVGFCAMSPYVKNAGAFYAYITTGMGTVPGVGAACIAVLSYNAILLACYAMLGHFLQVAFASMGVHAPWWAWAIGCSVAAHLLCVRGIEFSGRLLLYLMVAQVAAIVLADVLELHRDRPDPLALLPFTPQSVFTSGFGPSLIFVVASFMGVETAAIYSQEVRDPRRAVPRAMYSSILFIGALYATSIWLMLNHFGMSQSLGVAVNEPGSMWLGMFETLAGPTAAKIGAALVITSLFASVLSFTNVVSRYWHAMASRGLVWPSFARTHVRHQSPHVASLATMALMVCSILGFAQANVDPMLQALPWASVPAAVGVVAVQALAALSAVLFFRRHRIEISYWRSMIAPALSALVLTGFLWQMIVHIELLSGLPAAPSYTLALTVLVAGLLASFYALHLRRISPQRYARLAELVRLQ